MTQRKYNNLDHLPHDVCCACSKCAKERDAAVRLVPRYFDAGTKYERSPIVRVDAV